MARTVIIGGGQAAASTVMALRQRGYRGDITLIGDEPFPPYQRPPLSKAYMKGDMAEERLYFKHAAWYDDNDIDLVLATRATDIDRAAKSVGIEHGGHVDYDSLVLATGARPRQLAIPGADARNVFELRKLVDAERIRPTLVDHHRMIIVGAGYIGLEAAAVARQMNLDVTVLEYAPRVLARVTSPLMSDFFERLHRTHGVDIRTGVRLEHLTADRGRVTGAGLADGTVIDADVVLVGVGIVPNEELALDAGLACDDGIIVDRDARTGDPSIWAAGDCARRPLVHYEGTARLESVHNALEQGKLAAASILGRPRPSEDCPWFWSDQYDVKLQIAGIAAGYDDIVVRGDPQTNSFAAFYTKGQRLLATDAINMPQEFLFSKRIIAAGADVDKALLADGSVAMKSLLPA